MFNLINTNFYTNICMYIHIIVAFINLHNNIRIISAPTNRIPIFTDN